MTNRILVFGGNGRTGIEVVKLALQRGIGVNAIVRNPESLEISSDLLSVIKGTPMDAEIVTKAMNGVDAVVSTLNNGRKSDNPWAKPTSPVNLMEVSTKNALAAMQKCQVRRISVLSSAGVGDSFRDSPWLFRLLIKRTNMKQAFYDHNAVEAALRASDVDWTLARAMGLTNKAPKGKIIYTYQNNPKPAMTIARQSVASFLLDSLNDNSLIGKAPVISER